MRFNFTYRTKNNELVSGSISAPTREAAFAELRKSGIRPAHLCDAPGVVNRLLGRGKRWLVISVLTLICIMGAFGYRVMSAKLTSTREDLAKITSVMAEESRYAERSQIYGDPVLLERMTETGWNAAFSNDFDRALALYAVPGLVYSSDLYSRLKVGAAATVPNDCAILADDFYEVAQMKKIVNGMKRELRQYVADGGTTVSYFKRLGARQREERAVLCRVANELKSCSDLGEWKRKNLALRSMGLPMIEMEKKGVDE